MPYPNEHSCRLKHPADFKPGSFVRSTRKHDGKPYAVIQGRLKGDGVLTDQAYRYPIGDWTEAEGRDHCEDHEGILFEPAEPDPERSRDATDPLPISEGLETRAFAISEIRAEDGAEDRGPMITGHAAVFNQESDRLYGFVEIVEPGAFTKTLKESDTRALWQHDPKYVLGRRANGTLRVTEDKTGLAFEIDPPPTAWAADALVSIDRGDVNQASFQFRTIRDTWDKPEGGQVTRRLIEVELIEISPVTFPAYPQTTAQVRAIVLQMSDDPTLAPPEAGHPGATGESDRQVPIDIQRRRLDVAEAQF